MPSCVFRDFRSERMPTFGEKRWERGDTETRHHIKWNIFKDNGHLETCCKFTQERHIRQISAYPFFFFNTFLEALLQQIDSYSIMVMGKKLIVQFLCGYKIEIIEYLLLSSMQWPVLSTPIPLFNLPIPAVPITSKPWQSQNWMTESPEEATCFGQTSVTPAVQ